MAAFELAPYEQDAQRQILRWRDRRDGMVSRSVNALTSRVVEGLGKAVPEQLSHALFRAVQGALDGLCDAAFFSYSDRLILEEAGKLGLPAQSVAQLAECDLEHLDRLARRFFQSNKLLAALEGGGTGFGGAALIAADVPALFAISFRAIQQIGTSYGFDMSDPEMRPVVLSVLGTGAASSSAAKAQALLDMRLAANAFASGWSYQRVAEFTATGVAARAMKKVSEKLPRDIAKELSRKKLAQVLPFVGAAVGAGFNYWFLSTTTEAAYMLFRELYLERKYPGYSSMDVNPS
jgi:hypothetical protein